MRFQNQKFYKILRKITVLKSSKNLAGVMPLPVGNYYVVKIEGIYNNMVNHKMSSKTHIHVEQLL